MDIKNSIYAVAICLAFGGTAGCGGSDELSDEELEVLEEYVDAFGGETSGSETDYDESFDEEDDFEEF